jgi:ankyrin repeat protein
VRGLPGIALTLPLHFAELHFDLSEVKRTAPLHLAAAGGHPEMVELLIDLGADPLLRNTEFNARPMVGTVQSPNGRRGVS